MKIQSTFRFLIGRGIYWLMGGIASFGLAIALAFLTVLVSIVLGHKHQEMWEVGVGFVFIFVFWPGILTTCLIISDGLFWERISRRLIIRSAFLGLIPIVIMWTLPRVGVDWFKLFNIVGVAQTDMFIGFVAYVLICIAIAICAVLFEARQCCDSR